MNGQPTQIAAPTIGERVQHTVKLLDEMDRLISEISNRIGPVLRCSEAKKEAVQIAPPTNAEGGSAMTVRIGDINSAIVHLNFRLEQLLEHIDL